jgi:hypothetical protein
MNEEQVKAIKALEAAVRKCMRAGMVVKAVYTVTLEDGSTLDVKIKEKI